MNAHKGKRHESYKKTKVIKKTKEILLLCINVSNWNDNLLLCPNTVVLPVIRNILHIVSHHKATHQKYSLQKRSTVR